MRAQPLSTDRSAREAAPASIEEAQFRARMARVGGAAPETPVRRRRGPRDHRGDGFRLGWKSWLAIDCGFVLLVVAAVVAWPPVRDCRHQNETLGFYAGDSVEKCIRRGVADRLSQADQRVKMLVRGSGR